MHRIVRAVIAVSSSSLLTYGALQAATAFGGSDAPATNDARIVRDRAERPDRPRPLPRDLAGIFVPARAAEDAMATEPQPVAQECRPGARRSCFPPGMGPSLVDDGRFMMRCERFADGRYHWEKAACNTPLVVSFDDGPVAFTTPEGASSFAIGASDDTAWVGAATPWLALDRDGSGCIERQEELFGGGPDDANGFEKLARLDANHDGRIDASDPAFAELVLWADRDQDKSCTPRELTRASEAGLVAIDLHYTTPERPRIGSFEGERASFVFRDAEGATRRGRVVDVYLSARYSVR